MWSRRQAGAIVGIVWYSGMRNLDGLLPAVI